MTDTQNWRPETDAQDYFQHQKKQNQLADRRPVIRRASDLVGPGIGALATKITDFNDPLATYNGYYATATPAIGGLNPTPPAANAPNTTGTFVGTTTMDGTVGGVQTFTELETQDKYVRVFRRAPFSPSTITWGDWKWMPVIPPTAQCPVSGTVSTGVVSGTPTALPASEVEGVNTEAAFDSDGASGTKFYVLQSGVYSGVFYLDGGAFTTSWSMVFPGSPSDITRVESGTGAMSVPFVGIKAGGGGPSEITVTATQSSGGPRTLGWRLAITRIGPV